MDILLSKTIVHAIRFILLHCNNVFTLKTSVLFFVPIYSTLFVCYFDTEMCQFDTLMCKFDTLGVL